MESANDQSAIPRVALLLANAQACAEIEEILKSRYSGLLVLTERAKLLDFDIPFIIIMDSMHELAELKKMSLPSGSVLILALSEADSEMISVAFDLGTTDVLGYPFDKDEVLEKTEHYLETFRPAAH